VNVSAAVVQLASGIPRWGDPHPDDASKRAEVPQVRARSARIFEVAIDYATPEGGAAADGNPLAQRAVWRWGSSRFMDRADVTVDGYPITNVLCEPFNPPLNIELVDSTLTITRNEANYDERRAALYRGAVASDGFAGFRPGEPRMIDIQAAEQQQGRFYFWQVVYEIHFRLDEKGKRSCGWRARLLNQSERHKIKASDPNANAVENKGPSGSIYLADLARDGTLLPKGAKAVWLQFELYPKQPFASLHLWPR
jgi:hypothetical protein